MLRKLSLWLLALATLSACATAPVNYGATVPPRPYPPTATTPLPVPQYNYALAPHAALQSELFACGAGYGSNIGPLGSRRESLVYSPYIDTPAGALIRDPTDSACLSSGFGWRGTSSGGGSNHTGMDLANANGGFIFAAADGRVYTLGDRGGYGITLEIDHGRGVHTLYGHLSEVDPNLSPGAFVAAGAPIARMGMTGNATGVHLHYEVIIDGLKVDPLNYGLPPQAQPVYPSAVAPPIAEPPPIDVYEVPPEVFEGKPEEKPQS